MSDDLPDPESPVTTTSLFFGIVTLTFFRLLLLAPMISICLPGRGEEGVSISADLDLARIDFLFGVVFVEVLTGIF